MNVGEWVAVTGVSYVVARRQYVAGMLPVPTYWLGRLIMAGVPVSGAAPHARQTVVYARVSSADRRLSVDRVVTEVGSALGGHREKFVALLGDRGVSTIVVEYRDRFARFGAEYVEVARSVQGRRLLVVDPAEVDGDLVRDVTVTSLCADLYGRRGAADRARRAIDTATRGWS